MLPILVLLVTLLSVTLADKYFVVFRPGTPDENIKDHLLFFRELHDYALLQAPSDFDWFTFEDPHSGYPVKGYITDIHPYVLEDLTFDANVEFIEKDSVVHTMNTQSNADWGLARVSQRNFTEPTKYVYRESDGDGVSVYVIDTGVFIHHEEFENRAHWGITIPDNDSDVDGNGHGTHVAGIIAGKTYGVSKRAKVIAVKVLRSNGSGSMSDVVKGIEWVITEHNKNKTSKHVANMSLGGGYSKILNKIVDSAVAAGIHFVVAAGNDNEDACMTSPASARTVLTVGASDYHDQRASFSNWGECVNIFAPGHQITSSWNSGLRDSMILSGTSMASPFVAGVVSALLSRHEKSMSPKQLNKILAQVANKDILTNVGDASPNLLLYSDPPESVENPIRIQTV